MPLGKVIVVEDEAFARSALVTILSSKGFEVVAGCEGAEEALHILRLHRPEVMVVDLDLGPGPNGIDLAHAARGINPRLGIVFLTSYSDPRFADPQNLDIPEGSMYLTKGKLTDVSNLVTSILQVRHLPNLPRRSTHTETATLTDSQVEILHLVSSGLTTAAIAEKLGITEKAIEASLSKIHKTLGLTRNPKFNPRIQLTRAFFALSGKRNQGET